MRAAINQDLLRRLPQQNIDIRDTKLTGFVLRCRASGSHSYRVSLGRGRAYTIGNVAALTPHEARDEARKLLGDVARGNDPIAAKRSASGHTLKSYLTDIYEPWATAHRKTGAELVARIRATFTDVLNTKLGDLNAWQFEKWRSARLKAGRLPSTVNRDLNPLKAALNRAVEWNLLTVNPLAKVKPLKIDRIGVVRYLSGDEERRLRATLAARDERRRAARIKANRWRAERAYDVWPEHGTYSDHMTPLVLLGLNTGLRRGELFSLRWTDVDLVRGSLVVRGDDSKSGQTRHVPLNTEAQGVLETWRDRPDRSASTYVFPGREEGSPLDEIKTSWNALVDTAKVENFRFHDIRHTFASRLVQAGVDLNTVRELLGHADLKMTLRYAHLAPRQTEAAVAKLVAV